MIHVLIVLAILGTHHSRKEVLCYDGHLLTPRCSVLEAICQDQHAICFLDRRLIAART